MLKYHTTKSSVIQSKEWKFQTKILIFSLVITTLIMAVLYLIALILFSQLTIMLTESSEHIFKKTTENTLTQYMTLQKTSLLLKFQHGEHLQQSTNKLFQIVQLQQVTYNKDNSPQDCLDNPLTNDSLAYVHSFCYMYCNKAVIPQHSQDLITLTALLTESLSIYNFDGLHGFAGSNKDGFFTMHRGFNQQGFQAKQRPWYIEHMKQMKNGEVSIYSNPYIITIINYVQLAQTTNLTYLNQSLAGVIGNILGLANLPIARDDNIHTIITNSSGYIMFCKWYDLGLQTIIPIYNESITGFDQISWTKIQDQASNSDKILLIYNTVLKSTVQVTVTRIDYPRYYLILTTTQNELEQQQISSQLESFELKLYQEFGFLVSICLLFTQSFAVIIISYTLRPINNIVKVMRSRVYDKFTTYKSESKKSASSAIQKMIKAYDKLIHGITNKKRTNRAITSEIQEIQYPINDVEFKINSLNLKDHSIEWTIEYIKQLLKQKINTIQHFNFLQKIKGVNN